MTTENAITATIVGGPYDGSTKELTYSRNRDHIIIYEVSMMSPVLFCTNTSHDDTLPPDGGVRYDIMRRYDGAYRLVRQSFTQ